MCRYNIGRIVIGVLVWSLIGFVAQIGEAAQYKVLVVMSYEEAFSWGRDTKEGIDAGLADTCELKYFYMDTKTNFECGPQKAKEAYVLYHEFQPDGVIAADDNAQAMFVVPYLKDKVDTPVMFCGVNAEPEKYGYPASNVSGILERRHIYESLKLAQQLVPSIKTVGFVSRDNPGGRGLLGQIQDELDTYSARFTDFRLLNTLEETIAATKELRERCDALLIATMEGMPDKDGKPLTAKQVILKITKAFGKPTIGTNADQAKYGTLCTVVQTGQEQGRIAAEMLLKAMEGMPVSEIPITRNKFGRRIINVDTMQALGIKPKPAIVRSAELVKTEK